MQPPQRVRAQAAQPAGEREAGRRDGPVHRRPLHRRTDRGNPGRRSQRGDERALRPAVDVVPGGTADDVRQRRAHRVQVRGDPPQRGPVRGDGAGQHVAQPVEARSGGRRHGQHRHVRQAVVGQQPPDVGHGVRDVRGAEPVDLVEHYDHDVAVAGEWAQVPVVDRGVGVLLRVEHPDEHVDQRDEPVDLQPVRHLRRVVVRQVEQHEPAQVVLRFEGVPAGDLEPVQQRARACGIPHRRVRHAGRRPAHARQRHLRPGQRVEQRRLAAAGRSGEGDDGVRPRQPHALTGAPRQLPGGGEQRVVEPALAELDDAVQGAQPARRPPPRRRRCARHADRAERHRASSTAAGRPLQRLGVAGVGGVRGEQVGEPRLLGGEQGVRPARAGRRGPRRPAAGRPGRRTAPRAPSGTAAVVPPATPTSAPVGMNAVLANTAIMTIRPVAFTPYAAIAGVRPARRRPPGGPGPAPRPASRAPCARWRRAGWATSGPAAPRWPAAGPCPRRWSATTLAARSAARSAAASTSSATPDSSAAVELGARLGPAGDRRGEPVPQPAHPVLQRAQQLPGADELLPAGQDLPAQQRAVAHAVVDLGDRARVGGVGRRPAAGPRRRPAPGPGRRGRRCAAGGCPAPRPACDVRPRPGGRRRAARSENQPRSGATTGSGSRPSCKVVSGTTNSGAPASRVRRASPAGARRRRPRRPAAPGRAASPARCRAPGRSAGRPTARRRRSGRRW